MVQLGDMTTNSVRVINTVTGAEGTIARHLFENPVFGAVLVEMTPGTKKFVPELFKPQSPEVFEANHEDKVIPRKPKTKDTEIEEKEEG